MLETSKTIRFANIVKRYESNIDGGTYFIYNPVNSDMWIGNYSAKLLLDLIDGIKSIDYIKKEFLNLLNTDDINTVFDGIDIIFYELIEKGMLVYA